VLRSITATECKDLASRLTLARISEEKTLYSNYSLVFSVVYYCMNHERERCLIMLINAVSHRQSDCGVSFAPSYSFSRCTPFDRLESADIFRWCRPLLSLQHWCSLHITELPFQFICWNLPSRQSGQVRLLWSLLSRLQTGRLRYPAVSV
jgi:hypothetical protein